LPFRIQVKAWFIAFLLQDKAVGELTHTLQDDSLVRIWKKERKKMREQH